MKYLPVISIIVPVYKVEPYLHRCIDSILAQTFTDFELILIDDGSPDNCGAICDEYAERDSRLHVIHQENGGQSSARNAGIDWVFKHSESEWIAFIDSDDWVHPNYLQCLYQAAKKCETGISACYHRSMHEYIKPDKLEKYEPEMVTFDGFYALRNENVNIITPWGKLVQRAFLQDIRYPVGRINEDIFVTHKLLTQGKGIAFVNQVLYYYYVGNESTMRRKWSPARLSEIQGYEELIAFTEEGHYSQAKIRAIETYYWSLDRQIKELQKPEYAVYQQYLIELRKKLRIAIRQYHKSVPVSISQRHWLLEDTYPVLMSGYWLMKAAGSRVKKLIGRG